MANEASKATILRGLEDQADLLNAYQVDLVAQIEAHLRAVHHTMRRISSVRAARYRIGPELSNGERVEALKDLASEMTEIQSQINIQAKTCDHMGQLVVQMQETAVHLRRMAQKLADDPDEDLGLDPAGDPGGTA